MKEERKPKPILREPEHMLVSKGHTCADLREAGHQHCRTTAAFFRNLEVERQSEFNLEIQEVTASPDNDLKWGVPEKR
jgi:hypothetical protein